MLDSYIIISYNRLLVRKT